MTSVLKYRVAACALAAALSLTAGTAQAADLGGDCCADLEERIAELEATTARKGNRKVSLEVSGHVNEAILWWDDGEESNVGTYTNDDARTRFRFKGEAKIDADWKAGYLIEIGVRSSNSKRFTQDDDNGEGAGALDLRHSVWYLDSKKLGRVWVGLTGGAGESVTETNLAATKDIAKYSDIEDIGLGLNMRFNGAISATSWRRLLRDGGDQPGEGRRFNMVRYDTPEFAGFTGTANFGEDDTWEVGARYKGALAGFKLAAAVAYGENNDTNGTVVAGPTGNSFAAAQTGFQCPGNEWNSATPSPAAVMDGCHQVGGSISVMHEETGVYFNLAGGRLTDDNIANDPGIPAATRPFIDDEHDFYAGEIGIERKWMSLGKTTLFAQYFKNEGGTLDRGFSATGTPGTGDIVSSTLESYGIGVVQGIDAAAMHLYLTYRHYEADITRADGAGGLVNFDADDLDVVMGGAIIRF